MMHRYTLALPSKGALSEPTVRFLSDCGLRIWKPNPRQYTGSMPAVPQLDVMFQRVKDVVYKVADGTAQLGITGIDVVREYGDENVMIVHDNLRYGQCQLLVAVPESWVDVESMMDLVDISHDLRESQQRNLRVATTFTNSTRRFLHAQGLHHFTLVKADGAIEAGPTLGYADVIVDLTQTGTTLRENRLKPLPDGVILESQACLIANRQALKHDSQILDALRVLLEHIDASLVGRKYYQITANVQGHSPEEIARRVLENPVTRGLQGPTISKIYGFEAGHEDWYTVTIIVDSDHMLQAVEHLRSAGGTQTIALPARFVFLESSPTFARLKARLG